MHFPEQRLVSCGRWFAEQCGKLTNAIGSVSEGAIDTTCASGELIFNIFSALAQFERRLIQERTKAGLAAARARGRMGGRPKTSPQDAKVRLAKTLLADKSLEVDDICETLKISRSTLYRYANL